MQPESSDGFASVGTILPKEGAALLPGGSFRFTSPEIPVELPCATRLTGHPMDRTHNKLLSQEQRMWEARLAELRLSERCA